MISAVTGATFSASLKTATTIEKRGLAGFSAAGHRTRTLNSARGMVTIRKKQPVF